MNGSRLFAPSDDLRPFVRGYFVRDEAALCAAPFSRNRFPSVVYPSLSLALRGKIKLEGRDGTLQPLPPAFFSAAITRPIVSANVGTVLSVSYLFRPGVLPHLSGEHPATLVDTFVSAENLWPRETANPISRIEGMPVEEAIPVIEDFIRGLLRRPRRRCGFEDGYTARIAHGLSCLPLSEVVAETGLSLRQFERRFLAQYGITPKLFQRLRRFEQAVYALRDDHLVSGKRLASIAAELGYFDQSHFVKDFRRFSGVSPTLLLDHVNSETDDFWSYRIATPHRSTP